MKYRIHTGLKGRVRWRLERHGKVVQEGEQANLITDAGLNEWANALGFGHLVVSLAVGTSSVAPTFGDLTLGNEVARSSVEPIASPADVVVNNVDGTQTVTFVSYRRIIFDASYNLTEFGYFRSNVAATSMIRQLFRDELGNPVTITALADDTLTVQHSMTVVGFPNNSQQETSDITITEYDRDGAVVATDTFKVKLAAVGSATSSRHQHPWLPARVPTTGGRGIAAYNTTGSVLGTSGTGTTQGYVPDSFERSVDYLVAAFALNVEFHRLRFALSHNGNIITSGLDMYLYSSFGPDVQATYEKLDTHSFEATLTRSWARL